MSTSIGYISAQMPTLDKPQVVDQQQTNNIQEPNIENILNHENASRAKSLQIESDATGGNALENLLGLLANVASYNSVEKIDYDRFGNQVVDANDLPNKRYRSTANISENDNIREAIEQQRRELEKAKKENKRSWSELDFGFERSSMSILRMTQNAIEERIYGPLWNNWTNGKDFLATIKSTLGNIINTFDPLMDLVDQLQEYVNGNSFETNADINLFTSNSRGDVKLPLGLIAMQALNIIIQYIRDLIKNIEILAESYTDDELNVLVEKGTTGSDWGTVVKTIQDLIVLIVDCIRPYISNLVIALILDAIDMIVDKLDDAGILSPSGPLKMIPIAITLVRSIMSGNLEAIEEMVKKTVVKLINVINLARIAMNDPSVLWSDTERLDKEIAIARYDSLSDEEKLALETDISARNNFLSYASSSYSAPLRYYLQKLKNETKDTFRQISFSANSYIDNSVLSKKTKEHSNIEKNIKTTTSAKQQEASQKMTKIKPAIKNNSSETNLPKK